MIIEPRITNENSPIVTSAHSDTSSFELDDPAAEPMPESMFVSVVRLQEATVVQTATLLVDAW